MNSKPLHFSESVQLPLAAAAARFAILGKSGAGKTNTDTVLVEEFMAIGVPTIVLDVLGNMWGLRSSGDGKSAGLPIAIFGGPHGDVPLRADRGAAVADLLSKGVAAVLDLSQMERDAQCEFVADFLPALQRLARRNLHVVIEEAEAFAPERPTSKAHARARAVTTVFARTARNSGIGWTMSSQRPQLLAKDVIDSSDAFLAMRMTGELAQDAIGAEARSRIGKVLAGEIIGSLPSLAKGEAWLIPDSDWLDGASAEPLRFRFRWRRTFDSAKPPRVGEERSAPMVLADVDLDKLRAAMADDESVASDGAAEVSRPASAEEIQAAEERGHAAGYAAARQAFTLALKSVGALAESLSQTVAIALEDAAAPAADNSAHNVHEPPLLHEVAAVRSAGRAKPAAPSAGLTGPEQRILDAIAWMNSIGIAEPDQHAVGFVAGYSIDGSAYKSPRASLRTKGLVDYLGENIALSAEGRKLAAAPAKPATRKELHQRVLDKLPGPETKLLTEVLAVYPKAISNEDLGKRTGYSIDGSAFKSPRARLRTLGLVEYVAGGVRARDFLFPEKKS